MAPVPANVKHNGRVSSRVPFSDSTLRLFAQLLDGTTLNVGAPDFEEMAEVVIRARRELAVVLPKPGDEGATG